MYSQRWRTTYSPRQRISSKNVTAQPWSRRYPPPTRGYRFMPNLRLSNPRRVWRRKEEEKGPDPYLSVKETATPKAFAFNVKTSLMPANNTYDFISILPLLDVTQSPHKKLNFTKIFITGGDINVTFRWLPEMATSGYAYIDDRESYIKVKVWVMFIRNVNEIHETIATAGFPANYSPYVVGDLGKKYYISKQKYEFSLYKGKEIDFERGVKEIKIRMNRRVVTSVDWQNAKLFPVLFITGTGYLQNDNQAVNLAWNQVEINSDALITLRGLEKSSSSSYSSREGLFYDFV